MAQKVKGFRRKAVYGQQTRRQAKGLSWMDKVNPPNIYGWEKGVGGRTEQTYGSGESRGNERRKRLEEVRESEGYVTNGRGRKGDAFKSLLRKCNLV